MTADKDTLGKSGLSNDQKLLLELLMAEEGIKDKDRKIERNDHADEWPLSSIQERLWFMEQLAPDSAFYNTVEVLRVTGPLNIPLLETCINDVVKRHDILRATFRLVNGCPVQVIAPMLSLTIPVLDFHHLPESEREKKALQIANDEVNRPFKLSQGPLIRTVLIKMGEEDYISIMTAHHAIIDGWGWGIFMDEIVTLYNAFSHREASPLPDLAQQYIDYVNWQRQRLQGKALEQLLSYWRQQLLGAPGALMLPTDHPRPAVQTFRGDQYVFTLPKPLVEAIGTLSQEEDATRFMTLLAAYKVLLYRYTGQEDILVGFSSWGRSRVWMEELVGNFVNTLVLRTGLAGNPSFREVVKRVRGVVLGAIEHQDLPFEKLVEDLRLERDASRNQLLQAMIGSVLVNSQSTKSLVDVTVRNIHPETKTVTCDIELYVCELPDGMKCFFEYNADIFEEQTIERMTRHYRALLEAFTSDAEQPIGNVPFLTEAEQQLLVAQNKVVGYPHYPYQFIDELFSSQAERTPDAVALVCGNEQITYGKLQVLSNQLAHYLQRLGVEPEVPVGLFCDRSIEMVVGILGILKSGGVSLPLDPTYPTERLAFMASDAQISLLLTQTRLREKGLSLFKSQIICLDTQWQTLAQESRECPIRKGAPESLAYITYTSGSTGKPKGVLGTHLGVVNYLTFITRTYQIAQSDIILQLASISFDASIRDTLGPLSVGARVVIVDNKAAKDSFALLSIIGQENVTGVLSIVPSLLKALTAEQTRAQFDTKSLQLLLVSGEALYWNAVLDAQRAFGDQLRIVNQYGPTECTMTSTYFPVPLHKDEWEIISLGCPIGNCQVYILDRHLQPVPIGVPGELYIGGVGITRGYLNQPALTAERFVPHPFSEKAGSRLYRTGDLARYRIDGALEFLGRIDQQVKLRGFRIELGEIEAVLLQHSLVKQCVVVVQEHASGEQRLIAYILGTQELSNDKSLISRLRQDLQACLPEYMVPSSFVLIDSVPLMPNGKVDRQKLQALESSSPGGDQDTASESFIFTPAQQVVAKIWTDLLDLERIGIHENFFEIGGHSLLAMQVVAQIRNVFQVELPVIALFEEPTIAGIVEELEDLGQEAMVDVAEIAEIFLHVDQLSEEEAKEQLERENDSHLA